MADKIKLSYYSAGSIEKDTNQGMTSWRNELKTKLSPYGVIQYDPVERESCKTGKPTGEHIKYITGLKQSGNWKKFILEMDKVWFGQIRPEGHVPDIFTFLRMRKLVDGNEERDFSFWADFEAVLRSDFVVANLRVNVQTIGTIGEIFVAYMFKIPIYLVIDVSKTECNSTLLYWVLGSGGEVYYNFTECVDGIKTIYNLK